MLMAGLGSKRPLSCWVEAPGAPACEREWVYRAHALRGARRVRDADACFDDHCSVCIEGGALICCVSCPRAFHVACLERHVGAAFCPARPRASRTSATARRRSGGARTRRGAPSSPRPRRATTATTPGTAPRAWRATRRRDGETRLLCCDRCPRAFHARCAGVGAPGAALVAAGGRWRCAACADPPAGTADVDEAATLAAIENLCAKLPRTHFASLFGSRLAHVRSMAARLPPAAAPRAAAALEAAQRRSVASRLHFALHLDDDAPRHAPRRLAKAPALAATPAARVFAEGLATVPGALPAAAVDAARGRCLRYYDDVVRTVAQLELGEALEQGGFATFKPRQAGRFDMVVPDLLEDVGGGPWRPVVEAVLGHDARLCHAGVILALPGAAGQPWHSDGDHVHDEFHLPPHALNVFLPLVDCGVRNGATGAAAGDAIVFDWRLKHRGLPHRGTEPRPLVYLTYAAPWFVDDYNFSRDRFADLPPLVPASTRGDRAKRRGEAPPS
ncbi:hypothetical protein JL721_9431 [Aureococcus anophagefferens]|nr:hypothetical protein JL721_9431 [Aureococcus anophagefferens]